MSKVDLNQSSVHIPTLPSPENPFYDDIWNQPLPSDSYGDFSNPFGGSNIWHDPNNLPKKGSN